MPEGPEVRKYADALDESLSGRVIQSVQARTRNAREWLRQNGERLSGQPVAEVVSHGKHLIGYIKGGFYFHSHLMMWGRWTVVPSAPSVVDRRERARIVVSGAAAILFSAPIFDVGEGDPYQQIDFLSSLGPDVLPYDGAFNEREFRQRLLSPQHLGLSIGAALLNQQILAGVGNYLRAEILFVCNINPWRKVGQLSRFELNCLSREAPKLARRAYLHGATASEEDRARMEHEPALVYQSGREYGTRHLVFRRTNLACLRCGEIIRQLRQGTWDALEEERSRIIYFCPNCQNVKLPDQNGRSLQA
jgi:endonuclease-8